MTSPGLVNSVELSLYALRAAVLLIKICKGFLSTSDEAASGNWGLKDQLLALRWVQDNIEYFGGNKSDVTIFGESAGAASISFLMQFPSSENLFHKAIMESGSSLNEWALSRQARDCAFSLGQLLNVNTKNSKVLVRRLRRVNTSKLMISSLQVDLVKTFTTNPLNGLIYAPCKETDQHGDFLVGENYEYLRKGRFTRVPVIIGFNSQESGDFDKALQAIEPYLISYALDPRRLVPIDLNLNNDTIRSYIATQIRDRYCPRIHYRHLVDNNLLQFFTDDQFVRPINEAARLMSRFVPVYHYKFSYIDNITAENSDEVGVGAAHASELNYMFANNNNLVKTTSDRLTRLRMIRLWTNFVKTGNPTPEEDDLFDRVIWTTYDQGEFMDIGHSLKMSSDLRKYSVDWWKNIYDKYAIHPLDTY
ncbi:unnamed protein product [Phaedon cochleariae]|uniref:Carboxylic ester hydrolase n=1 Tax=Phaedon cochleariae TaxID=80249 RepID=A0A9N9SCS0_PHACE|nr:unnamed protein product [Phaedon cochleariae]